MGRSSNKYGFLRKLYKRLHRHKVFRFGTAWFVFLLLITVFGDFIANDKPLYCRYQDSIQFPILQDILGLKGPFNQTTDWGSKEISSKILPPIPYHFDTIDPLNSQFKSPFGKQNIKSLRYRHWLGTDQIGRDVAAGIIMGARVSLIIGFCGIGIAALIGLFLGSISGYYGDFKVKWSKWRLLLTALLLLVFSWLAYALPIYFSQDGVPAFRGFIISSLLLTLLLLQLAMSKIKWKSKGVYLRIDSFVLRTLEIFKSIPKLLLVLVISAILQPSIYLVALVIGITHWPMITMYMRGEMLKVREKEYLLAAQLQGIPDWRILLRHAIPNAIGPSLIAIMLGLGSAILAESFLSFLGLGIPPDLVSWGKLLASAREQISAWWLAIFPGVAIFLTIFSANRIGELLYEEIKAG